MNAIDPQDSSQSTAAWTESKETVSLETIDEIVARSKLTRLDLIKLDVEGAEVDALDGARQTISHFRPMILLEAEDARLASQGRTKLDLVRALVKSAMSCGCSTPARRSCDARKRPVSPRETRLRHLGWRPPVLV